jgi:hypothetical protein
VQSSKGTSLASANTNFILEDRLSKAILFSHS